MIVLLIFSSLPKVCMRSLETRYSFYNLQTKHHMGELIIDFSPQVAEVPRSLWVQTLGNQLIDHSPYIRYTTANIAYCNMS